MAMMKKKVYWVYILYCENGNYYTGYTINLSERYAHHLCGKGSRYTRSFKPVEISQSWKIIGDKSLAMKLEYFIKKLSRIKKEILIQYPHYLLPEYYKYISKKNG